jgi:hypothetical protein
VVLAAHVVEIAAGRVGVAGAGGDDAANLVVIRQLAQGGRDLGEQGDAQGVFLFRPIESQPGDAGVLVDVGGDLFQVGHCNSLFKVQKFKVQSDWMGV